MSQAYLSWPTLEELFPVSFPGVKTSRDSFLADIDRDRLEARLAGYFDPALSHSAFKGRHPEIMTPVAHFQPEAVRDTLRKRGIRTDGLVRYAYRPMDVRWLYWEGETDLLDRSRPEYKEQVFEGNLFFECRKKISTDAFDRGCVFHALGDQMGNGTTSYFPMLLRAHHEEDTLYAADERPNLSALALEKLKEMSHGCTQMNTDENRGIRVHPCSSVANPSLNEGAVDPTDLFFHALAILHAPAYRMENAGALRMDWPRIPWPKSKEALESSAALGRQVAALLDVEQAVPLVTAGKIPEALRKVAVLTVVDGAPLNPAVDLDITAGWGIRGQGGIAMPSEGRREGHRVFLNAHVCWDGIPDAVWQYSLGGYQVLKKWLSYRESRLLGRALTPGEAQHFTHMARRIAALLAMGEDLDANYRAHAGDGAS